MKKEWLPALLLTLVSGVVINGGYTAAVWGLAQLTPQRGEGERIAATGGQRYYANIAQRFTEDRYFWPRPSAVDYNAAGSGGSNKGPSNREYLAVVRQRLDTFLARNPGVSAGSVPADLVTASGSGLDPDLSLQAARVQVGRVARARGIAPEALLRLVAQHQSRGFGGLAPERINVLRLNLALDAQR